MGSGYYGEPNLGNERSSSSRKSSSKKGNSDKPKQPQRGLGVAQLEKIRLHSQMGCTSFPPSVHHHHHHHHNPYGTHNLSQEHIRMQTAYSSSSSFSYSTPSSSSYGYPAHQNIPMGYGDHEGITHTRYGDSQPTTTTSWPPGNSVIDYPQQYAQPAMTRQLMDLQAEESYGRRNKKHGSESSSQNSESSGNNQDLDLELRLSL